MTLRKLIGAGLRGALGAVFAAIAVPLLYAIEPFRKIRLGEMPDDRIGHLSLDTELFARELALNGRPPATSFIFIASNPANRQLLTMWKRRLCIVESLWLRRAYHGARPVLRRTRFHRQVWDWKAHGPHEIIGRGAPALAFTADEERRGREFLASVGIGPDDWFVCAHVRDPAYMLKRQGFGVTSYGNSYRDSAVEDYYDAMRWIAERGGFVLRMGAIVEKPLPDLGPRVIDYATKHRSDFLDIYLSAKCRLFLGSNSGLAAVPMIFDVPVACTNFFPFMVVPPGKAARYTPQLLRRKSGGAIVSLAELRAMGLLQEDPARLKELSDVRTYDSRGLDLVPNDRQDVLELAMDMLDLVERRPPPGDGARLQDIYRGYFSGPEASALAGRVGPRFLLRHRTLLDA